ncbi:hypothetical protein [Muriicola sp.]|uniref:hypothetical protein n=1 Tax=Muriicola sp. TaxID=2020856 RepID=UPI003C73656D
MTTVVKVALGILLFFLAQSLSAQTAVQQKIDSLRQQKELVTLQEKEALKKEVEAIVTRQKNGEISLEEARELKQEAAKKRALNIENKLAILDNTIALMDRNNGDGNIVQDTVPYLAKIEIGFGHKDTDNSRVFGIKYSNKKEGRSVVYDRRTYSDLVLAFGLNNAIIDGQSLGDSPYELGGSRFFEIGVTWRTRVFENSNFLRFAYGLSFQFNGLNPKDNQYFVTNGSETTLETFDVDLSKSKLRMDNLVIPLYLEFGPSKMTKTESKIRYSLRNQFRIGIGGYGGFNLGTRQKLKYERNGERAKDKLKRGFNSSDLVYGLAAYVGVDGVLLYTKYDLNPIFKDATINQRNISFGLRFDLD